MPIVPKVSKVHMEMEPFMWLIGIVCPFGDPSHRRTITVKDMNDHANTFSNASCV